MNEEALKRQLRRALESKSETTPGFEESWLAAQSRYHNERRRRWRASAIAVAVGVVAVAISLLYREQPPSVTGLAIADDLLASTLWTAPSDALLPQHDVDVYEIPTLLESTNLQEGSLL